MRTVTDIRQKILRFIKERGETTNVAIAQHLGISYEAVRQQLRQLEAADLVVARTERTDGASAGRPTAVYSLSAAGDHLFPKAYDELALELVDKVSASLGPEALEKVLAAITDDKVRQWASKLEGKSVEERVEALKGFYLADDPHLAVETDIEGLRLIEHNCPFLNVATRRPALCSVTISALSRLLGFRVTREKRFQDGDGRCVFRVHTDQPIHPEKFRFAFEEESKREASS